MYTKGSEVPVSPSKTRPETDVCPQLVRPQKKTNAMSKKMCDHGTTRNTERKEQAKAKTSETHKNKTHSNKQEGEAHGKT